MGNKICCADEGSSGAIMPPMSLARPGFKQLTILRDDSRSRLMVPIPSRKPESNASSPERESRKNFDALMKTEPSVDVLACLPYDPETLSTRLISVLSSDNESEEDELTLGATNSELLMGAAHSQLPTNLTKEDELER